MWRKSSTVHLCKMSWPPASVCESNRPDVKGRHAEMPSGGKAASSVPEQTCNKQSRGGLPPSDRETASDHAAATLCSALASARRSAINMGRSQSFHASVAFISSDARRYLSTSSPAAMKEPGAMRPATRAFGAGSRAPLKAVRARQASAHRPAN